MRPAESDLPLDMGTATVLSRALSLVVSDPRLPLVVVFGSAALLVPLVGPFVLLACLGLAFGFADETLGYTPPSTWFLYRFVYAGLATVLAGVAVALGLLFILAPGIYLAIKFALVAPAVWIGDEGPLGALADSWDLSTANQRTVIRVGLVVIGLTVIVSFVAFQVVAPALVGRLSGWMAPIPATHPRIRITLAVVSGVIGPLATAAWAVMYRGFPYP